jgi:methyltransferase family protein
MTTPPAISSLLGSPLGDWLMAPSERAALEGVLAIVRPSISIEIGTFKGGSLERIALYSQSVHAFDLERRPELTRERFPNVTFHIGSSHELLPHLLAELAGSGRRVDFALVDGDHSAAGVRADLETLLSSPCMERTVILLHDSLDERVRAGLEQVDYGSYSRVTFVDLDFVPGRVYREGPQEDEFWYGLGLVVTGWDAKEDDTPAIYPVPDVYEAFARSRASAGTPSGLGHGQLLELEAELETQRRLVSLMERSLSWRVTKPLRAVRRLGHR